MDWVYCTGYGNEPWFYDDYKRLITSIHDNQCPQERNARVLELIKCSNSVIPPESEIEIQVATTSHQHAHWCIETFTLTVNWFLQEPRFYYGKCYFTLVDNPYFMQCFGISYGYPMKSQNVIQTSSKSKARMFTQQIPFYPNSTHKSLGFKFQYLLCHGCGSVLNILRHSRMQGWREKRKSRSRKTKK